jgi:hypothetical protein
LWRILWTTLSRKTQYFDLYKKTENGSPGNPYKYEKNGKEKSFKLKIKFDDPLV